MTTTLLDPSVGPVPVPRPADAGPCLRFVPAMPEQHRGATAPVAGTTSIFASDGRPAAVGGAYVATFDSRSGPPTCSTPA